MPLVVPIIKKAVETAVKNELKKQFGSLAKDNPKAEDSWNKQAKIAAVIAEVIINQILSSAVVATTGSPTAQTGKIT